MARLGRLLLAGTLATVCSAANANAQSTCDRACLRTLLNQYLDAVIKHDPKAAPLVVGFRQTENAINVAPGGGVWKTVTGLGMMNAMVGDAGDVSKSGVNQNNPYYVQFFDVATIPQPSRIFVFLDEHPDSINDGYFLNKWYYSPDDPSWIDLPASYHGGATSFSFADGHSESHRWQYAQTKAPPQPESLLLPMEVTEKQYGDFYWLLGRMSVQK